MLNKKNKGNFYRKSKIILFLWSSFVFIFTCSCEVDRASNESNALLRMKQIRDAQNKYYTGAGKGTYGTLGELIQSNLITNDLLDEMDKGYTFRLRVENSKYTVNANPLDDSGANMGEVCIFLDETGIIRANYNAFNSADKFSEPIKNQ